MSTSAYLFLLKALARRSIWIGSAPLKPFPFGVVLYVNDMHDKHIYTGETPR